MTPLAKLEALYAIRERLHPLTLVLVVGFVETQSRRLNQHDITFIETMYPMYFPAPKRSWLSRTLRRLLNWYFGPKPPIG